MAGLRTNDVDMNWISQHEIPFKWIRKCQFIIYPKDQGKAYILRQKYTSI